MNAWRRSLALPPSDRRLLRSAAFELLRTRMLLWLLPYSALQRRLDAPLPAVREARGDLPARVGWAVAAAARRLPGMTCLVQSLAAHALLRRAGRAAALHIGVRAAGDPRRGLTAHAWVECEGRVVAGEVEDLVRYRVLAPVVPARERSPAQRGASDGKTSLTDGLASLLRGEPVPWATLDAERREVLAYCVEEDLASLVQRELARAPGDWPSELVEGVTREARAAAVREEVRRREVAAVLEALAAAGVRPVLFKGTALAYGVYAAPALRPRSDTDLVISADERDAVRLALASRGYQASNYCEPVFSQFELARTDALGVVHAFDFHWKVSTQSAFADLLSYQELSAEAVAVPALGAHARAAGPVHALLLACVHPAMHHRNAERLIWLYDIHLLAARLSSADSERLAELAVRKGVATICAHELGRARARFGTALPDPVMRALAASRAPEPSASYLAPERRWADELWSNLGGLPRWTDRVRLLREIAFPAPTYMLRVYGLAGDAGAGHEARGAGLARALLPALYLHRGAHGIWKVLRKRK